MLPRVKSRAPGGDAAAGSPCQACDVRDESICSSLDGLAFDELSALAGQLEFSPGRTIFYESDPAEHICVIVSGHLKLYKLMADGRRQVTGFLGPSDLLGMAMRDRYAYTAETITDVRLCRFTRRQFESLVEREPRLERRLLSIACNEVAAAQDQMLLLGRKTAAERIASFLHIMSERARRRGFGGTTVELPMTRSDIADHLGLTTETVSRCFTRLRKDGVISLIGTHCVKIEDRAAFIALASPDGEDEGAGDAVAG